MELFKINKSEQQKVTIVATGRPMLYPAEHIRGGTGKAGRATVPAHRIYKLTSTN